MSAKAGRLVVISGPSGAGKTSVCKALRQRNGVEFSVSATTRKMRNGERDGVDYHFLSQDEFRRRIDAGEFLEWAEYNGNYYGTLAAPMHRALAEGRVFVLEIEVQGTRQLRAASVPGLYVFIVPPSMDALHARLVSRGANSAAEIESRMAIARKELEARDLYDHVIVNEKLDEAIRTVEGLVGL